MPNIIDDGLMGLFVFPLDEEPEERRENDFVIPPQTARNRHFSFHRDLHHL